MLGGYEPASTSDDVDDLKSPRSSTSSILENVNGKPEFINYEGDMENGGLQPITALSQLRQKRKKQLYLFFGLASTIFFLLSLAVFSKGSSSKDDTYYTGLKNLSMDEFKYGTFYSKSKSFAWIETDTGVQGSYLVKEGDSYYVESFSNPGETKIIMANAKIQVNGQVYEVQTLVLNRNLDKAILGVDYEHNYRHSTFAKYVVLDVASGSIEAVYTGHASTKLSFAEWSPRGDRISFVADNNLYLRYVGGEDNGKVSQITKDGGADYFYARPDWVYEEEVLTDDKALWWSLNGEYLAFFKTNDSAVPEFPIPYFVQPGGDAYPELREIKYPKPGYPNPIVDILFLDVASEEYFPVPVEQNPATDDLITEVIWTDGSEVIVRFSDRESDVLKVSVVDTKSRTGKVVRSESFNGDWFEIELTTKFVPADASHGRPEAGYIDTISVDGYNHLVYFSPVTSSEPKTILTSGEWEVESAPSAFDEETNTVYFMATKKSSVERHLYSVKLDGSEFTEITDTSKDGYYRASFSDDSKFALITYAGPDVPWQKLLDMSVAEPVEHGEIIEDNAGLKARIAQYNLPEVSYGQVKVAEDESGDIVANYIEILPPNFNPSKKYPVLFYVYGGPVSQNVHKTFSYDFQKIISCIHDIIVVTVDGRGTGFLGHKFRSIVRDNLGHYEALDQITAAKHWASKPFVDEDKIAIWGWSYGGYMTLKTLETDAGQTFSYGMAVAPVTDWRFYDSVYTERYMHTPQHNPDGYTSSAINNVTAVAQNERFLLMHGTGDDNVHIQHSLVLLDKFDRANVENYDVHIFPDSDHSISYNNAYFIVYDKLTHWIGDAFSGKFKSLQ